MGNILGPGAGEGPVREDPISTERKRKKDSEEKIQDEHLNTPRKKKLKSTKQYIYDTLYVKGENHDVTILALDKTWRLHKLYLCQAHYFNSMFKGPWLESSQDTVTLEITDQNIDTDALGIVFGALYHGEVTISPNHVIPVLAAATFVGLDELIADCDDVMKDAISEGSVCVYHQAAVMYGRTSVVERCEDWLLKNIMTRQPPSLLNDISIDLMCSLVSSHKLFVMQVEMDIYSMLRKDENDHNSSVNPLGIHDWCLNDWLFLKLSPQWEGSVKTLSSDAEAYFKSNDVSFLEKEEGQIYCDLFRNLRLFHIINDLSSIKIIEQEHIIPPSWLTPLYRQQWLQMLNVEQGNLTNVEEIDETTFHRCSMRCGRVLAREGQYCWRWTGFNFGLDLLVSFSNKLILFKRNALTQNCPNFVSLHEKRSIMYRLRVASLNALGQTTYERDTGIKTVQLSKDEESFVVTMDRKMTFPLRISCHYLVYYPHWTLPSSDDNNTSPPVILS